MTIKQFKKNGYRLIKNAISDEIRDFVTQYALFDEIQDFKNEKMQGMSLQVPNAHAKYADPAMESLLIALQPLVEKSTGLNLYPTYSFYRVYRNGDVLHPHKDRPSCEISTSVCFNYSYDDSEYAWPIIMNNEKVNMFPGDMVVYRGMDIEHSRENFSPPGDHWHVQAFFHYVDANGQYSNHKYDGREYVGINNRKKQKNYIQYV